MSRNSTDHAMSREDVRTRLVERLRSRRPEIERAIFERILETVPDAIVTKSPDYQAGIQLAIKAVVVYCLEGIKSGSGWSGSIPPEALAQARRAARYGVSIGTIVRRYVAGHGQIGEFVADEAQRSGLSSNVPVLQDLRRSQETLLERITAAIEEEYLMELERVGRSPQQHRMEIVKRLLSSDSMDPVELADLDYEFNAPWHLGLIAIGSNAEDALRRLELRLGHKLLRVLVNDETAWAWLGGLRKPAVTDIERLLTAHCAQVRVMWAFGEPRQGIDGWRQTHQEAHLAARVALKKPTRFTRCADVLPEAAFLENEDMARLLIKTYLTPLNRLRKEGWTARQTLRAYLGHERSISAAASTLNVARRTIENRLGEIEAALGRPIHSWLPGLEIALRLEELGYTAGLTDVRSAEVHPPSRKRSKSSQSGNKGGS